MKSISIYWYVGAAFIFGGLVGAGVFNLYAPPAHASDAEGVTAPAAITGGAGYLLSAGTNQAWIVRPDGAVYVCEPGASASPAKGTAATTGGCRRVGSLQ
jgi:hypothetical protein